MGDQFGKFIRLFGNIFFSFIGFIVLISLLLLGLRFFMGALDYLSWFRYFYLSLMLMIPSVLFITVFVIFLKRTKFHPSKLVRIISDTIFVSAILSWLVVLGFDSIQFLKNGYPDIDKYFSYNLLYLVINVATIFIVGIIQALTTAKEKDWMERRGD
jgi:hypothetical protein